MKFHSYGPGIEVSSNQFEGPILLLPPNVSSLNLSKNKFSGFLLMFYLDLSNNSLSGRLPDCWFQFDSLAILNLANNSFFGKIPGSMSFLPNIQSLSLYNNSLTGGVAFILYEWLTTDTYGSWEEWVVRRDTDMDGRKSSKFGCS